MVTRAWLLATTFVAGLMPGLANAQSTTIGASGVTTGLVTPAGNLVISKANLQTALGGKADLSFTPTNATAALSLQTQLSYSLTPANFGPCGTGGDDTAVLQAAINACAGKATLRLPPGITYNISNTLTIPAGSDIQLDGTIFKIANPTGTLISSLNITGSNVSIYGKGTIDGNRANQNPVTSGSTASAGISSSTAGITRVSIRGIEIKNCPNWPINLTVGITNATVEDCILHDSGNSCEFNFGIGCRFVTNTVYNINDGGVVIYAGCLDCRIDDNTIYGCVGGIGIYSDNAQTSPNSYCSVSNNTVYNIANFGISVEGVLGGGTQYGCKVQNNLCYGNNTANIGGCGSYKFQNCSGLLVTGNQAIGDIGAHPYSFWLTGPLNNCLFLGNFVMNCGVPDGSGIGGYGFACTYPAGGTGGCTNIVLKGNTVIDNRGAASSTPGVGTGTQIAVYGDGHFFGTGSVVLDNDALGSFISTAPIQPNFGVSTVGVLEGYLAANASDQTKTFQNINVIEYAQVNVVQAVTLKTGPITVGTIGVGYIDFYSSGGGVLNSDGRILVSGGTSGTPFNGQMILYSNQFILNNIHVHGSYANDAAAQAAGVPIDGIYRNGSVLQVRVV